jgi:hypothetical protein
MQYSRPIFRRQQALVQKQFSLPAITTTERIPFDAHHASFSIYHYTNGGREQGLFEGRRIRQKGRGAVSCG